MKRMEKEGFRLQLDQNLLKWIAVVSMTIDHTGMVLFPQAFYLRLIGRLAFPIYCYLLVMGFLHTKSRPRYMAGMAVFALLSEIPFDLACYGRLSFQGQNVFFMLFFCLGMLWLMHSIITSESCGRLKKLLLPAVILLLTAVLAFICRFDYSFSGPFLVTGLYLFIQREKLPDFYPKFYSPQGSILLFLLAMLAGRLIEGYGFSIAANSVLTEAFCLPSAWLMQSCSQKRKKGRGKYFFYLYYPLHLLILYGISRLYL